jgi:RNA polymerase sigma-70 factor (ECF subfamily)
MAEHDEWLAERFEGHRARLRAVAYRMLGSTGEADDAVQEAWLRLSRSGAGGIENLGGWLTTVVARVCLNMLRSRRSRREEASRGPWASPWTRACPTRSWAAGRGRPRARGAAGRRGGPRAARGARDAHARRAARLRAARHVRGALRRDRPIVGRSPPRRGSSPAGRATACGGRPRPGDDLARQREVVDAFLAASRGGDFDVLLAMYSRRPSTAKAPPKSPRILRARTSGSFP